jgi:hypothetical protein
MVMIKLYRLIFIISTTLDSEDQVRSGPVGWMEADSVARAGQVVSSLKFFAVQVLSDKAQGVLIFDSARL